MSASFSPSPLPARPSLEQLRKQAKDLLKQLRAGDAAARDRVRAVMPMPAEPGLGDSQFVLSREYGFDTWAALVRYVDAVNPQGLRRFELLAQEVAVAYTSADVEMLREINWVHGTSFRWYSEPDLMQQQLPGWFTSDARTPEQALADARQLVAAMCGFDDWSALASSLSSQRSAAPVTPAERPRFYWIAPDSPTIGVRGPLSERHWDVVVSVIRERGLTGVWAPGASDAAVDRLSRIHGLTRLYAGGGWITDEGLQGLARLPALEELSLGGPRSVVTDRGLEIVRRLPNLTRFWTTWTPHITDAGIARLAGCERLEVVDLMGTNTGDGAIAALVGKPSLRKLATGRLVTDAGVARLGELPRFARWEGGAVACELGQFDSEPVHVLLDGPFTGARLPALEGLAGLNLFWHTAGVTTAGFAAVAALPRLAFLRVDREGAMNDPGLLALSRSATLQSLSCAAAADVTGRGFAALASMPLLRGLAIDCGNVEDAALAALPRFPSLRTFWPSRLADAGFRHVGRCAGLESLALPRDATDAATAHIADLPHLKSFAAARSHITDRSLAILARMPSLETVDIHGCTGVTDAGVALLASLPRLSKLVAYECPHLTTAATGGFRADVRVDRAGD